LGKFSFSNRVIKQWNALYTETAKNGSLFVFRQKLDSVFQQGTYHSPVKLPSPQIVNIFKFKFKKNVLNITGVVSRGSGRAADGIHGANAAGARERKTGAAARHHG